MLVIGKRVKPEMIGLISSYRNEHRILCMEKPTNLDGNRLFGSLAKPPKNPARRLGIPLLKLRLATETGSFKAFV
jgi:hypothetical protein